jgi:hypothetical protein
MSIFLGAGIENKFLALPSFIFQKLLLQSKQSQRSSVIGEALYEKFYK